MKIILCNNSIYVGRELMFPSSINLLCEPPRKYKDELEWKKYIKYLMRPGSNIDKKLSKMRISIYIYGSYPQFSHHKILTKHKLEEIVRVYNPSIDHCTSLRNDEISEEFNCDYWRDEGEFLQWALEKTTSTKEILLLLGGLAVRNRLIDNGVLKERYTTLGKFEGEL